MKRLSWILVLVLALTPALAAQVPEDSSTSPADQAEARQLREQVRQRWAEHVAGTQNWHSSLWNVLMFQAWLETQ